MSPLASQVTRAHTLLCVLASHYPFFNTDFTLFHHLKLSYYTWFSDWICPTLCILFGKNGLWVYSARGKLLSMFRQEWTYEWSTFWFWSFYDLVVMFIFAFSFCTIKYILTYHIYQLIDKNVWLFVFLFWKTYWQVNFNMLRKHLPLKAKVFNLACFIVVLLHYFF